MSFEVCSEEPNFYHARLGHLHSDSILNLNLQNIGNTRLPINEIGLKYYNSIGDIEAFLKMNMGKTHGVKFKLETVTMASSDNQFSSFRRILDKFRDSLQVQNDAEPTLSTSPLKDSEVLTQTKTLQPILKKHSTVGEKFTQRTTPVGKHRVKSSQELMATRGMFPDDAIPRQRYPRPGLNGGHPPAPTTVTPGPKNVCNSCYEHTFNVLPTYEARASVPLPMSEHAASAPVEVKFDSACPPKQPPQEEYTAQLSRLERMIGQLLAKEVRSETPDHNATTPQCAAEVPSPNRSPAQGNRPMDDVCSRSVAVNTSSLRHVHSNLASLPNDSKEEGIQCMMTQIHHELMQQATNKRSQSIIEVDSDTELVDAPTLDNDILLTIKSPDLNGVKQTPQRNQNRNKPLVSEDSSTQSIFISEGCSYLDPQPVCAAETSFEATYTSFTADKLSKLQPEVYEELKSNHCQLQGSTSFSGYSTLIDHDPNSMPPRTQPDGSQVEETLPSESTAQNICKKYKDDWTSSYPIQKLKYESIYLSGEDSCYTKHSLSSENNSIDQISSHSSEQSVYLHELMRKYKVKETTNSHATKKNRYHNYALSDDLTDDNSLDCTINTNRYLHKYGLLQRKTKSHNQLSQKQHSSNAAPHNRCSTPTFEDQPLNIPSFHASNVLQQTKDRLKFHQKLGDEERQTCNHCPVSLSGMSNVGTVLQGLDMCAAPLPNLCSAMDITRSLAVPGDQSRADDPDPTIAGSSPLYEEQESEPRTSDCDPSPILDLQKIRTLPKLL